MLRSLLHFWKDFFGFRPTETLVASTWSTDLALNFLPLNEYSNFLLRLFTVSLVGKLRYTIGIFGISQISVEIKLFAETCLNSDIGFWLYISLDVETIFF